MSEPITDENLAYIEETLKNGRKYGATTMSISMTEHLFDEVKRLREERDGPAPDTSTPLLWRDRWKDQIPEDVLEKYGSEEELLQAFDEEAQGLGEYMTGTPAVEWECPACGWRGYKDICDDCGRAKP